MARTWKRYGPAQVSNVAATKITAGATEKILIRHIHVSNKSGGSANLSMSIGADAAATRIFDAYPVADGTVLDHFGIYELDPTEILQAFSNVNNALVLTITYEVYTP